MKRFILCLLLLVPQLLYAACPDCDTSAGYVTVTTSDSSVSAVPGFFIVRLSDLPAEWHTAMSDASDTDGKTIRVSLAGNQVPCFPLGVNTSTDTGSLFIYGSGVSPSADTAFNVYVGDGSLSMPAVTDTYGRNAVFADYAHIYIFNSLTDLTGSGVNLSGVASPTGSYSTDMEGIESYDMNGSTQYFTISGSPNVTDWPLTLEAIVFPDVDNAAMAVGSLGNTGNLNNFALLRYNGTTTGDPVNGAYRGNSGSESSALTSVGFTVSTWEYSMTTRDGDTGTAHVYINGGGSGSQSTTLAASTGFNTMAVGALRRSGLANPFNGKVALFAVSNSVRSSQYSDTMKNVWRTDIYSVGSWAELGATMDVKKKTNGFMTLTH